MDMVRSHSKMEILSKATSLRANFKGLGCSSPIPINMKANFVMGNIMGKVSTHGVQVVITKEDMRMEKRVDMEYM